MKIITSKKIFKFTKEDIETLDALCAALEEEHHGDDDCLGRIIKDIISYSYYQDDSMFFDLTKFDTIGFEIERINPYN